MVLTRLFRAALQNLMLLMSRRRKIIGPPERYLFLRGAEDLASGDRFLALLIGERTPL